MVAKETTKTYTREELKKVKKTQKEKESTKEKSSPKIRVRLLPIWLRVLLIVVLMGISVIAGLVVGYGVIGNGNPEDALDKSTWQHIIDLVEKK
ncbi:DNA-directed RNA polymerase subunit beta [Metabacillus litoralis]|uniref:DNA-directed RNA polymerase subunit beta n=1 Tax=Metabacillus litoralis TaxID=152268 RepID=A0A5C6VQB1_9BACI|nr:DNA-directed RNA polymerase subunit beta [Metabacillus litoralis]TXC85935.1 DNA-directed RNA polymerase subunit beta [Metabacillus litoralis]